MLWAIGRVLPATHVVEIMRGVVLRDAGPMELLPNVRSLVAMSIVLVWASVRRFQKVTLQRTFPGLPRTRGMNDASPLRPDD